MSPRFSAFGSVSGQGKVIRTRVAGRTERRQRRRRLLVEQLEDRRLLAFSVTQLGFGTPALTAEDLAQSLVGDGVAISNVSYTGSILAAGKFTDPESILGFDGGIVLSSGKVVDVPGPNSEDDTSTMHGLLGDSDLEGLIPGYTTYDAAVLEFDFVPNGDAVTFSYVFSSEEYNEFSNGQFNDVFGFFINGENRALLADLRAVAINTVNGGRPFEGDASSPPGTVFTTAQNPRLYHNNDRNDGGPFYNIEADGFTVELIASANVNKGQLNHIKLAIADAGDAVFDSNVFIKAGSLAATNLDYGDAPDSYGTTLAADGARHPLLENFYLGTSVDAEDDGIPTPAADGDDADGLDDEDGIVWTTTLTPGQIAAFTVEITAPSTAFIDAWIDWDQNGTFDASDKVTQIGSPSGAPIQVANGANLIEFEVPTDAVLGDTYARFRLTGTGNVAPTGLASDGEVEDYLVTLVDGGEINGQKFHDLNANGVKDENEPGLNGWTIRIDGAGGLFYEQVTSDIDLNQDGFLDPITERGVYRFQDVNPGQWTISEQSQANWTQSAPVGGTHVVDLLAGQLITGKLFGNYTAGAITVIKDSLPDGPQDFEFTGDLGVFSLVDDTGDLGVFSLDDDTEVTLSNTHVAANLAPGTYEITESALAGWDLTDIVISDPTNDSTIDLAARKATIVVGSDENVTVTFKNIQRGEIYGQKFEDLDADGRRDPNEPGLDGFTIVLMDLDYNVLDSFITTSMDLDGVPGIDPITERGLYRFLDVEPGTYLIGEVPQTGWIQSMPRSDVYRVTVESGQVIGTLPAVAPVSSDAAPNWADRMDAGQISQLMTVLVDVDIDLDGVSDGVFDLSGMAGIAFGNPVDTNTDGIKDQIDTEIVEMHLAGIAPVGPTEVRLGTPPSLGQVDQAPGSTVADSFFDVFIEIDTVGLFGGPLTLHNSSALRMTAEAPGIAGIPPYGAVYSSQLSSPLPLYAGEDLQPQAQLLSVTLLPLYGVDFGNHLERDFGDAPDDPQSQPGYSTLLANNGAWHFIRGPWLGPSNDAPDAEPDGQPTAAADGDDLDVLYTPPNDDEDGVVIPSLPEGVPTTMSVEVSNAPNGAVVEVWIDWDGIDNDSDGSLFDANELVFAGSLANGIHSIPVTAPVGSAALAQTYARVRISSQGVGTYLGGALDGEVEDHLVEILPSGSITVVKDTDPDSSQVFDFSSPQLASFQLDGDSDPTVPSSTSFPFLSSGTYVITEAALGGWALTDIVIADPTNNSTIDLANRTATIVVDPGDNVTVTFVNTQLFPSIDIEKSTNGQDADSAPGPLVAVGAQVTWTYAVTNTGNTPITTVGVSDDQLGVITNITDQGNGDSVLDPGETWTYTTIGTAVAGQYANTATVNATDAYGNPTGDSDASHYFGVSSSIEIDKVTNGGDGVQVAAGDAVVWTYTVTNTGNVALDNVQVTDNPAQTISGPAGDVGGDNVLSPNEVWTFTASGTAVAGPYSNIATVTADDPLDAEVTDSDGSSYFGVSSSIEIDKVTNGGDGVQVAAGDAVVWTYTVTNTGNVALDNVQVTDNPAQTISGPAGDVGGDNVLSPNEVWTFTASGTAVAGPYSNIATVTADDPLDAEVTDSDGSSYFGVSSSIEIDKVTNGGDGVQVAAGDAVVWTYTVTNTGNVALDNVQVTDNPAQTISGPAGDVGGDNVLSPNEVWTFTASGTAVAGPYSNIATVTADDPLDAEVTDSDGSSYFGVSSSIEIEKVTNGGDGVQVAAGDAVVWTYTVTNTGNVALDNVQVTDNPAQTISGPAGDVGGDNVLSPNEVWTFTASGTAVAGPYSNIATVTADDPLDAEVTDSDGSSYFGVSSSIEIDKVTNGGDGVQVAAGDAVVWTYTVTNTGNVALDNVQVTDNPAQTISGPAGDVGGDNVLSPNEVWTFTASGTAVAGPYSNIATVTADDPLDAEVTDSDGSSYFGVASSIEIDKVTNGGDGVQVAAGDAVVWTYTVTNTGNVALDNVQVTDNPAQTISGPAGDVGGDNVLSPNEVWTFTASGTAVAGPYSNIATVTADDPLDAEVTDSDGSSYFGVSSSIEIEKVTNGGDGVQVAAGDAVVWTYTVTNTGNVALDNVQVTDNPAQTISGPAGDVGGDNVLSPNEVWTFTASGTAVAGPYSNIATVTADDPLDAEVTDSDGSSYFGVSSSIEIEKVTNGGDGVQVAAGDAVVWTYTVTNTGNVALDNVQVTDNPAQTISGPAGDVGGDNVLSPNEVWTFTASGTAVAGPYSNIATVTADDPLDAEVTDSDGSSYFGELLGIDIEKSTNGQDADQAPGPEVPVASTVTFDYVVTNTGNVPLWGVVVVDDNGTGGDTGDDFSPSFIGGDVNSNGLLDLGETWTYTATRVVTFGQYANVAVVTGSGVTGSATDSDASHHYGFEVDFGDAPDPSYPTLLASNGARHRIGGALFLGTSIDAETDGQPDATATGDDLDGNDDEDGVTLPAFLTRGDDATITVVASMPGYLNAWIDFNIDGDWADAGEQIFVDQPLVAGPNPLTISVPVGQWIGQTFARFRIDSAGGLSYTGLAADGEVEDYTVELVLPQTRRFDFDGPNTFTETSTDPDFTSVRADYYNPALGYGWKGVFPEEIVSEFERPDSQIIEPGPALLRDGHFQGPAKTFQIAVDPNVSYDIRVYTGDAHFSRNHLQITVEGAPVQPGLVATGVNEFKQIVIEGASDVDNDGLLEVTFANLGGDPYWVVNGLDIATQSEGLPDPPDQGGGVLSAVRRFDFGTDGSPEAAGYTRVGSSNTFNPATTGYGWVSAAPQFSRSVPTDLLRDGHFFGGNTFLVNVPNGNYVVNVMLGDASFRRDRINVYAEDDPTPVLSNLSTAAGEFVSRSFPVTVSDSRLNVQIGTTGGDPYVTINALEIWDVDGGQVVDHNLSVDTSDPLVTTISGTASAANVLVTVSSTLGTVSAPGGDASTAYAGYQVLSGAGGAFSFQIAPLSGGGTVQFTSEEVTGAGSDSVSHTYAVAATRSFDFNQVTSGTTAAGWTGVRGNQLFGNGTSGYGWQSAVKEYDRGSASATPELMYRDGHWEGSARTFRVTADSSKSYEIILHKGDQGYAQGEVQITVEGTYTGTAIATSPGEFTTVTLAGVTDVGGDGVLDIVLQGSGTVYWVANGIEVNEMSPLLPAETGSQARSIEAAALDSVFQQAVLAWEATGLTAAQRSALAAVQYEVRDLAAAGALGLAGSRSILIDDDGAGLGWHVGDTRNTPAAAGYDLLTAVTHELGHVLGLEDIDHHQDPRDVMQGVLERGLRRLPEARLMPLTRFGSLHDTGVLDWGFVARPAVDLLGMRPASASGPRMVGLSTGTVDRVLATGVLDDFRLADQDESEHDVLSDLLTQRRYEEDDADAFFAEFERQEETAATAD
jgi:uncharacterized membrane protein